MSSSTETYATMLIAQDIALFSTSSLFTVRLQQRLAIVQYEEFSTQLTAIWNDHTSEFWTVIILYTVQGNLITMFCMKGLK